MIVVAVCFPGLDGQCRQRQKNCKTNKNFHEAVSWKTKHGVISRQELQQSIPFKEHIDFPGRSPFYSSLKFTRIRHIKHNCERLETISLKSASQGSMTSKQSPISSSAKSSFTNRTYEVDYYVCDNDHNCRIVPHSWLAEQTSRLTMRYSQSVLETKTCFTFPEQHQLQASSQECTNTDTLTKDIVSSKLRKQDPIGRRQNQSPGSSAALNVRTVIIFVDE